MPVLFAADPPLPFNLNNSGTANENCSIGQPDLFQLLYRGIHLARATAQPGPNYTARVRPQEERGRTKTSRSLQGTNTRLQDEPDTSNKSIHLVIFFTARIYFPTKLHDFIFLLHEYYACHDQHEHH